MRNLWILTRFLLKSGPGKSNQKSGKKKAFSDGGRIVVYLLLGVCLLPVSVLLFLLGYSGYTFLQPLGLETLLIEFVCAIGMMVIFFYGLPLFLSEYYMDSDLVKLLPLPFTPAQIVGAKGFCCLLNEYYLIVLLFFPFLLGYGISAKMGIFYWINMILACLIFPVVPLVYAAVLTMLVMRLFKNIRNKDFLSYLGFAASLIFAIGINVFSRSIGNFEMQDIMNLMESQKGTLRAFRTIFPNLPLMTGSLADASFLKMILYIATTAVILAVFFALAWKIYLPAVLGMSETTSEKRILSKEEVTRTVKSKNPVRTYAMIEWKKLYRTPAWFMNCVLMPLIWPVFMLGIALISIISSLGMAKTHRPLDPACRRWHYIPPPERGTARRSCRPYCRRNRRHDVHVLRDLRHSDVPKGQRIHLYEMHSDELSRPDPCHAGKRHPDQSPWHLAVLSGLQHDCCRLRSAPGDPSLHHGDHGFIYPVRQL